MPSNVSRGSALTVNRTSWPSWIEPMSVSLTDDQISSRPRSLAIRKRLGAFRLADDGLADVDPAVEDHALDRRADRRVAEVDLGLLEVGPGDGQRAWPTARHGPGRLVVGHGGVVFLRRDDRRVARAELLGPVQLALGLAELDLGLLDVGLGAGDAGPRLVDPRLEQRVVEPGQHRPRLDGRAVADRLASGRAGPCRSSATWPATWAPTSTTSSGSIVPGRVDRRPQVAPPDRDRPVRDPLGVRVVPVPDAQRRRRPRARPSSPGASSWRSSALDRSL